MRDLQKKSLRRTIAWQRSCSDFRRKIADIIVSILSAEMVELYWCLPFFSSMQRSLWYWYARSDAGPTKVRQMHPGHDLKSKSTALHQNRRAQSTMNTFISNIVSLLFFSSPPFLFSFLFFLVVLILCGFCSATNLWKWHYDCDIMLISTIRFLIFRFQCSSDANPVTCLS